MLKNNSALRVLMSLIFLGRPPTHLGWLWVWKGTWIKKAIKLCPWSSRSWNGFTLELLHFADEWRWTRTRDGFYVQGIWTFYALMHAMEWNSPPPLIYRRSWPLLLLLRLALLIELLQEDYTPPLFSVFCVSPTMASHSYCNTLQWY